MNVQWIDHRNVLWIDLTYVLWIGWECFLECTDAIGKKTFVAPY